MRQERYFVLQWSRIISSSGMKRHVDNESEKKMISRIALISQTHHQAHWFCQVFLFWSRQFVISRTCPLKDPLPCLWCLKCSCAEKNLVTMLKKLYYLVAVGATNFHLFAAKITQASEDIIIISKQISRMRRSKQK